MAVQNFESRLALDGDTSRNELFLITDNDTVYEQDILRDPSSIRHWLAYAELKHRQGSLLEQSYVLERACIHLPRSYKLWRMVNLLKYLYCGLMLTYTKYLEMRIKHLRTRNPAIHAREYSKVNALFERALVLLNKMPRIWEMYLTFLMQQPLITLTRKVFDRALRALPITQHQRIWSIFRRLGLSASGPTALQIWKRYTQISAESIEKYIELLISTGRYDMAMKKYVEVLGNPKFRSQNGKSTYQLWNELVDLVVTHAKHMNPEDCVGHSADSIIKSGIKRFKDQRGKLWTDLATYWITAGSFDKARDIFEEGMASVNTVREFTLIFDSYAEFEESIIGVLMDRAATRTKVDKPDETADFDLDVRMLRFEQLMDRRPFLLNDVLLRQDPNNVAEWAKRIVLWGKNKPEIVQTYADAIATIEPRKAHGKLHELWANYAKLYEADHDLGAARVILEKAVKVPFKSVAELADVWCEWAEMELRSENFDRAVAVMAKATLAPKRSTTDYFDETLSPQQRVHKSWKLWSFYVDLVESVSGLDDTRAVYERIFELRIATPQTVVNYANLLEENGYYEESYKAYERGLDLFSYPVAFELWNLYLDKAVNRKVGIERLRDLFEQAIEHCPPRFAKPFYLMYGNLEEERGLARHAMRIYERATRSVSEEDRFEMFNFYITKSTSNFGLTSTRPIYERAITTLPDREAAEICLKFAEMERRLGEIDRARGIYGHASQFCDPRTAPSFWSTWESFEVQHGNEDTFKEMLRIKRSVQAQYNTDVNFIASQAIVRSHQRQNGASAPTTDAQAVAGDPMVAVERQAQGLRGFVSAQSERDGENGPSKYQPAPVANPDALDIDMDK